MIYLFYLNFRDLFTLIKKKRKKIRVITIECSSENFKTKNDEKKKWHRKKARVII